MLVWLLPLGLIGWGVVRVVGGIRTRRQDPWTALLKWGDGAGRPIEEGETALEYGNRLAVHVIAYQTGEQDAGRHAAREMEGLGSDVTDARYAPQAERQPAIERAIERWGRLRGYLKRLRLRKPS